MAKINFTMATPDDAETIILSGAVHKVNLHWRKNISCWFYIPKAIIRSLNLKAQQYAYFYVVNNETLLISFRDPNLKSAKKRTISYAKTEDDLAVIIPCSIVDRERIKDKKAIQLINATGQNNCEWQIRFL